MTVLYPGRRKAPPAEPWERDRAEFAALMKRLGSDDEHVCRNARLDLERIPYEDAVRRLAALWPGEEQTRRRRMPWVHFFIRLTALGFLLKIAFLIVVRPGVGEWVPLPQIFLTGFVGSASLAALTFPHTSRCQKGMGRTLTAFPDARLMGMFIDALGRTPFVSLLGKEERDTLRAKLVDLLPRYRQSDLPPLDAHQQAVLLGEVRAVTKRLRRKGVSHELSDDKARFLVVTLDALGWEALRGGPAPGDATVQAAQRDIDNMTQALGAVPDAEHVPNLRQVRDAAEECRVRLGL